MTPCPALTSSPSCDHDAHDLAGHGRSDLLRTCFRSACGTARAQRTWILNIDGITRAADDHVELALQRALALDLVGFAVDQHRQHVARGQRGVDLDRLAVDLAVPYASRRASASRLMRLAVHNYVVGHSVTSHCNAFFRRSRAPVLGTQGCAAVCRYRLRNRQVHCRRKRRLRVQWSRKCRPPMAAISGRCSSVSVTSASPAGDRESRCRACPRESRGLSECAGRAKCWS